MKADNSARGRGRRRWRRTLVSVSVLVVLWLLSSYIVAYFATGRRHPRAETPLPDIGWGRIEPFRLATSDGEDLGAWFIDGQPEQPVVLLLHGHRGRRWDCLTRAEMLASSGYPSLLISLRAHDDSTGELNDFGYSARHDVVAAVEWLRNNHPGRPVVIWGCSMGSGAALFAAKDLGDRVCGYILECPYQDLRTAAWNRAQNYLPPLLDSVAYAGLLTVAPLLLADVDAISPVEAAAGVPLSVPVLILAGGADRAARPHEARAVAQRLGARVRLVLFENAAHMRLSADEPGQYERLVMDFIAGTWQSMTR